MPSVPAAPPSVAPAVPSVVAEPPPTERPEAAQSGDRFPIGVTYDPYKTGACKTEQDFRDNWAQMRSYGIVRIYGMACGQIPLAVELAKANNQKLMAGIWLSHGGDNEDIQTVVREITQAVRNRAGGDWSVIALVSVENERVNEHEFTASEAVDGVNRARQALRFSGYNGPVGAVETVPAMLDNPSICENSDLALVNVHSFFDANTRAEDSGQFVQDQVARVRDKCGGKRVIVTEAGWPHQGDSHDLAVPSRANQRAAIDSIRAKFDHDLFLFNAFDSEWKTDWAGSFSAERYWGILG
jgi:exo-beta-1,3-glucanase (GH17 family)